MLVKSEVAAGPSNRPNPYLASRRMGRFAERYSDDQRHAIVTATVDDRMTAPDAVWAASEGLLYDLPAFDFSLGTARDYAGAERRRRRGDEHKAKAQGTPEERTDALVGRSLAILEAQMDRLEKRARRELPLDDIDRLKKLGSALREVRALARGIAPTKGGGVARREQEAKRAAAQKDPDDGGGLVAEMMRDHRQQGREPAQESDTQPTDGREGAAAERPDNGSGEREGAGAHVREGRPAPSS